MNLRRICLCLLALSAATTAAAADIEVALTSGRTLRGEVVSENDTALVLRLRQPVRGGVKEIEISCQRADIMKRKDLPSATQQYAERKQRTPDTVPEQCSLAQWCYENCLREQARDHAVHVLETDAENAWAQRILDNCGYMAVAGKWVDEVDYLKSNNMTRLDGKVVKVEYAEARKELAKALAVRDHCASERDAVKAATAPQTASGNDAKVKQLAAAAEAAKKAVEDCEKRLTALNAEAPGKGDAADARLKRMTDLRNQIAELQAKSVEANRQLDVAKRKADFDKNTADQAKARLPDLEADLAKAVEAVNAAIAKLPADDPAVVAARAPAPKGDPGKDGTTKDAAKDPAKDAPKEDPPKTDTRRRHEQPK